MRSSKQSMIFITEIVSPCSMDKEGETSERSLNVQNLYFVTEDKERAYCCEV